MSNSFFFADYLISLEHILKKRIGTKDFNSRKGAWTVDEKLSLPDAWPSGVFGWGYSYGTPWCHRCPFPWAWCDQFAMEVMTRRRKLPAIMLVMGWPCNYEYCIMNDCGVYIYMIVYVSIQTDGGRNPIAILIVRSTHFVPAIAALRQAVTKMGIRPNREPPQESVQVRDSARAQQKWGKSGHHGALIR